MNDEEVVGIEFDSCERESERAVCVVINGFDRKWIPKSVIAPGFVPSEGDGAGRTWVAEWFAEKEGLV